MYRLRLFRRVPRSQRKILIVGNGVVGRQLEEQVNKNFWGIVTGFLDDDAEKQFDNPKILGSLADAETIIKKKQIDDIVITLPANARKRIIELLTELHKLPIKVWLVPDYLGLTLHKAKVEDFAGIPMLDLRAPALSDSQRMFKRAVDIIIALLIMPPALILMGIISIIIRLDSQGKILFRQERVGENGYIFKMLKFRTMVENAEELQSLVEKVNGNGDIIHKSPDDPRVTRAGRFLRKASLDELPQIFNRLYRK